MQFHFKLMIFICVTIILVDATEVRKCQGENSRKLDTTEVVISNCTKGTCKLRKKSDVHVELKVKPERDIKHLTTTVYANILGIPLPFVGVDGSSACDKLFLEDGTTKAECPLKAGQSYVYKNSFPVLELYPKVNLVVHWALTTKNTDVVCFEVPAKIL